MVSSQRRRNNEDRLDDEPPPPPPPSLDLLSRYNDLLDRRPVLTKSLTAAAVQALGAALGSALANRASAERSAESGVGVVDRKRRSSRRGIDWLNVLAFAVHGFVLNGPVGHYWFEWLEKHGPKSRSKSMLLDQLVASPTMLVVMLIFLDSTKAALREIPPSFGRTLTTVGPTIVSSWRFWPVAVYCTFKYLKKKHYTVALNLCSIAWTMYLSKTKK